MEWGVKWWRGDLGWVWKRAIEKETHREERPLVLKGKMKTPGNPGRESS